MSDKSVSFNWVTEITDSEGKEIIALYNEVIERETIIGYSSPITELEGQSICRDINSDIKSRRKHLMLVVCEEKVIGMVFVSQDTQPNCLHIFELTKGIIKQSHRGKKILRQAFAAMCEYCESLGGKTFILDVRKGSRAHKIWSLYGFQEFGELNEYAYVEGKFYPGVYMFQRIGSLKIKLGCDEEFYASAT